MVPKHHSLHIYTYTYIHTYMCNIYTYIHTHMYMKMVPKHHSLHIYTYTYIHTYMCNIYTYIHTHMYMKMVPKHHSLPILSRVRERQYEYKSNNTVILAINTTVCPSCRAFVSAPGPSCTCVGGPSGICTSRIFVRVGLSAWFRV